MDTRERILYESAILFKKHGARNIKVDDLASQLGISKKTLYFYFKDKEALVFEVTKGMLLNMENNLEQFRNNSDNAIDELIKVMKHTSEIFKNINPDMLFDLRNHFARAWKLYRNHMKTCLHAGVVQNIERGIKEKLYRNDIDPYMVALMRMAQIDAFFNPELMPLKKGDLQKMHEQTMLLFLHGLLSDKGNELLKTYKKKKIFQPHFK